MERSEKHYLAGWSIPVPRGRLNLIWVRGELLALSGRSWWEAGLRFTEVGITIACLRVAISWGLKGFGRAK
jgi:hypothetical protein